MPQEHAREQNRQGIGDEVDLLPDKSFRFFGEVRPDQIRQLHLRFNNLQLTVPAWSTLYSILTRRYGRIPPCAAGPPAGRIATLGERNPCSISLARRRGFTHNAGMAAGAEQTTVCVGPARITLSPLEPVVWQPLAGRAAGPASLCLELLPLAQPGWENVCWPGGELARPGPESWAALPAAAADILLKTLCAPWLIPNEEAELKALEDFLRFSADFPQLSCAACQEQEAAGEASPECAACPRPALPLALEPVLGLYSLLAWLPEGAGSLGAELLGGLSPRRKRLLALQLARIHRWALTMREKSG